MSFLFYEKREKEKVAKEYFLGLGTHRDREKVLSQELSTCIRNLQRAPWLPSDIIPKPIWNFR